MLLFLRREAGGGAGPVVDAPRDGAPVVEVVAAAGAVVVEVEVGAASPFAVLPREKSGVDDDAGAAAGAAVVDVSAEDLPALLKRLDVGFEESGAAEGNEEAAWPPFKEPNKFDVGAEVAGVEEPAPKRLDVPADVDGVEIAPNKFDAGADVAGVEAFAPNRDGADGALVVAAADEGFAAGCEKVGEGDVKENVGVD